MHLSGLTVVRNGVSLGYPFIEAILSLLEACDEYVICECYSEDDTYEHLVRLQRRYPHKIRIVREKWPEQSISGNAIGVVQTRALQHCRGRWIYLLQADEIMPPENLAQIRGLCQPCRAVERLVGKRRFNSYSVDFTHLADFQTANPNPVYRWAIRLIRNRRALMSALPNFIVSDSDGWQFRGPGCSLIGVAALRRPVIHVGCPFPINFLTKCLNQAVLYPDWPQYQQAIEDARQQLQAYQRGEMPSLPTGNPLQLPAVIEPLIGQMKYCVREELFD